MPKYPLENKTEGKFVAKKIIVHLAMNDKRQNSVVTALSTPKTNKCNQESC